MQEDDARGQALRAGEADDLERFLGPRTADHRAHDHLEARAPRQLQ